MAASTPRFESGSARRPSAIRAGARIEYHEEERAGFHNVYLDRIQAAPEQETADTDPDGAAWRTAVEATPWLVGSGEPDRRVPPDELFDRLKPFKERVSDDIRGDED